TRRRAVAAVRRSFTARGPAAAPHPRFAQDSGASSPAPAAVQTTTAAISLAVTLAGPAAAPGPPTRAPRPGAALSLSADPPWPAPLGWAAACVGGAEPSGCAVPFAAVLAAAPPVSPCGSAPAAPPWDAVAAGPSRRRAGSAAGRHNDAASS